MEWPKLSQLVEELQSGKRKPTELVAECLEATEKAKDFNAITEVNPHALERAKEVEKSGKKGCLYGVPFVAKDNFLTNETHTTAGSNILKSFKAPYQATAIAKLEAEGAILLGKANLDAFGHGVSTENSDFGVTKNPVDPTRVAGGSSGGSAVAVALNLSAFALGTDTGGSSRAPASFSGVVGLKPTYGLVSRYGVIAMASSTDCVSPITRSVEDAALVLDVIAGKDEHDSTAIERASASYAKLGDAKKLKIGVINEHMAAGLEPGVKSSVEQAIEDLRQKGFSVETISIPINEAALAAYYVIVPAEISSNLARYDGVKYGHFHSAAQTLAEAYDLTRSTGFGAEAKRRILIGTYVLSSGYYEAYYKKAQAVRTMLIEEYKKAFSKVDILLGPTMPTTAFKIGEKMDPLSNYLADVLTVTANLVGIPAISVPVGNANGLPVGLQLMAPQKHEAQLLAMAKVVEDLQ